MSNHYKVGDLIRSSDGSKYRGKILYISKEEDTVRHQCLTTGNIYEKSYFGFFCRYSTLEEYDIREAELEQERLQEIAELQAKPNLTESEKKYLQHLSDSILE